MRKFLVLSFFLITLTAMAQTPEKNPKDLWTHTIDVTLGDNWRQKTITVPGKGTPNVVDFFRAFAKAYPCDYHDLLMQAIDGDKEVRFCHEKPYIKISEDACYLRNESFSMRVFYDGDKPAALGVCLHKAITTELQDAYYYRYNNATRKLTPLAKGSDFTGGILKRWTSFFPEKDKNEATMYHSWGRCNIESRLVWSGGKFVLKDPTKDNLSFQRWGSVTASVFNRVIDIHQMEARWPYEEVADTNMVGGTFNSLPICIAILDYRSKDNFYAASAMEGYYYFTAKGWERNDGTTLVAFYTECAPEKDYIKNEAGELVTPPHRLTEGDDVSLNFYLCNGYEIALYLDPASKAFADVVCRGLPSLEHNEWRCVLSPDSDEIVFVNQADGHQMVFTPQSLSSK